MESREIIRVRRHTKIFYLADIKEVRYRQASVETVDRPSVKRKKPRITQKETEEDRARAGKDNCVNQRAKEAATVFFFFST